MGLKMRIYCILLKGQIDTAKMANGSDQNGQMEMTERANRYCQKGEPIPDNIPDNILLRILLRKAAQRRKAQVLRHF